MSADRFEIMRRKMVSNQLRTVAVDDPRVVDALGRVPREDFVPTDRIDVAYADLPVPLGGGRSLNSPMATARLLNEAAIGPGDRVLIVGSATGYAMAVAGLLGGAVFGVESDASLGSGDNIVTGPLEAGAPDHAPFDVIVIDGAVEDVPQALVDQLSPGGRLTTGLVEKGITRLAVARRGGTGFALVAFADADVVVLPGFARARVFAF